MLSKHPGQRRRPDCPDATCAGCGHSVEIVVESVLAALPTRKDVSDRGRQTGNAEGRHHVSRGGGACGRHDGQRSKYRRARRHGTDASPRRRLRRGVGSRLGCIGRSFQQCHVRAVPHTLAGAWPQGRHFPRPISASGGNRARPRTKRVRIASCLRTRPAGGCAEALPRAAGGSARVRSGRRQRRVSGRICDSFKALLERNLVMEIPTLKGRSHIGLPISPDTALVERRHDLEAARSWSNRLCARL